MDDMKQLIEKYKRELIEYSKAAMPPKERLEFPEMIVEQPSTAANKPEISAEIQPEETADITELSSEEIQDTRFDENTETHPEESVEVPADTLPESQPTHSEPQIIGYSDNGDFSDSFSEMMAQMYETARQLGGETPEGVSTVTPETAEELDDVPMSGSGADAKLARRDFSEEQPSVNSPEDIAPLEQSGTAADIPAEQEYQSVDEYTDVNYRSGTLRFRVFTAQGALPVAGASVVVSKPINGDEHIFYSMTTDNSGLTDVINLPAPPKELSETPDSMVQPYAVYNADISAEGYNSVAIRDLPVFEGVQSLQKVALVPDVGQETEVIVEQEPALNGGV